MKKVWILTGISESGDHYGPEILTEKPTEEELADWCHYKDGHFGEPDDYEKGPGSYGSYVYLTVTEEVKDEVE